METVLLEYLVSIIIIKMLMVPNFSDLYVSTQ